MNKHHNPYRINSDTCWWCGTALSPKERTIDHILSKPCCTYFRLDHKRRLGRVTACQACNSLRSSISLQLGRLRRVRQGLIGKKRCPEHYLYRWFSARTRFIHHVLRLRQKLLDLKHYMPYDVEWALRELQELS